MEKDKQVEIWARLVLMRFDPKEINDDNLDAFARHLTGAEVGVKIQALNAIGMMGELAAKKLDAVLPVLNDEEPAETADGGRLRRAGGDGRGREAGDPGPEEAGGRGAEGAETPPRRRRRRRRPAPTRTPPTRRPSSGPRRSNWQKLIQDAIKRIDAAKPISPADQAAARPEEAVGGEERVTCFQPRRATDGSQG